MYIYKITNNVNNHFYIGKTTKTIEERFSRHRRNASYNTKGYLYNEIRKHGIESFSIKVIEETTNVNDREQYWIAKLNPQYNMTAGGEGGDTSKSPNFIEGIKKYHANKTPESYATYGMKGKKHPQKNKPLKKNWKPVYCDGFIFPSVTHAMKAWNSSAPAKRLHRKKPNYYYI